MKNLSLIKVILLSVFLVNSLSFSYASGDDLSPVVKVVSYKNIYWKYIEELGWWSASIINKDWYIVTNNHVVDDGNGNVSDYFNICLSKDDSKKPDCFYTATFVERDKDLDIAILKIDSKDIFWKDVNLSELSYLTPDFTYEIKAQNDAFAIWFPWIWSETITKTKWIISWITDYNWHKYIKSDTLISWWNSWWALLNKDWKLIWVPTFLVWWWYDPSIGYSISIKEVKSFLDKNLVKKVSSWNLDNFIKNKIKLDKINNDLKLSDKFLNFTFSKDYEFKNYIEDKWFILKPKLEWEYFVSSLYISLDWVAELNTEEDFLYYLEKNRYYSKSWQKLIKKEIWWIEFYTPVYIWDTTMWESSDYNLYIARIWNNKMITMVVEKPAFEDSEKNKIVKSNVDKVFSLINFNKETLVNVWFSFDLNSPNLSVLEWTVLSDKDWVVLNYYWNLYDYFQFEVSDFLVDDWKWKDIEEIYKNDTLKIENDYKSMISIAWHKWYIACKNDDYRVVDEKWKDIMQNICIINIYGDILWTNSKEFFLKWKLISDKKKIEKNLATTLEYLENNLVLEEFWDGETKLVNVYENIVPLSFKDIKYQSDNYKKVLKKLVKYNLVKNSLFLSPDKPIKWKEFLYDYFRFTYNYSFNTKYTCEWGEYTCLYKNNFIEIDWKKVSMYDLFKEMEIPLDQYVDYDKTEVFVTYMNMKLSWVTDEFSDEWFLKYKELSNDSVFSDVKQKVDEFNNKIYWKDNMWIQNLLWWEYWYVDKIKYIQTKDVYFDKTTWNIVVKDLYKKWKFDFSSIKSLKEKTSCDEDKSDNCYKVLTKSLMIDLLVPNIDFTIFDPSLKNQSKSVIE